MPNRLAHETSPYLRQHAANPVDWFPWGSEAFAAARERDVPIFLSVGYSSCHWCHVMAHESFEDAATAAVMNRLFVNVKVDREERPDVDAVYMQAVQALSGRGGWPMSVWCTPDGRPFYGGTYYPRDDRQGMPSFVRVCGAVAAAWEDRRGDLDDQADTLTRAIRDAAATGAGATPPSPAASERALAQLRDQFDARFGGFGRAPKFPQPTALEFVARAHLATGDAGLLGMLTTTLDAMAAGGIHDHVGGGFARYSTDSFWLVPHFEKMLYDNALLARVYLYGYQLTGADRYRRVVEDTIGYVLRDLADPRGGFGAAEDADSEGVEGKFYLWSAAEIREVCGDDADEVIRYYGVTDGGNFVDPHTGFGGNILHAVDPHATPTPAVERGRAALLAARAGRVRPGLDDKVLLGWNALFVRALVEAGAALARSDWLDVARATAHALLDTMRRADGRLLRSRGAPHLAYAEDHAALVDALLTLAELDDASWLDPARSVADELLRLFHDPDAGGFFTTGNDAEQLVVRAKDAFDDATPSANAVAAGALLRLAVLTGETRYRDVAEGTLAMLGPLVDAHPTACTAALVALERLVSAPLEIVVLGDPSDAATRALRAEVAGRVLPPAVSLFAAAAGAGPEVPLLAARSPVDGRPTAFVCEGYACRMPVTDPAALRAQLDDAIAARRRGDGAHPGA